MFCHRSTAARGSNPAFAMYSRPTMSASDSCPRPMGRFHAQRRARTHHLLRRVRTAGVAATHDDRQTLRYRCPSVAPRDARSFTCFSRDVSNFMADNGGQLILVFGHFQDASVDADLAAGHGKRVHLILLEDRQLPLDVAVGRDTAQRQPPEPRRLPKSIFARSVASGSVARYAFKRRPRLSFQLCIRLENQLPTTGWRRRTCRQKCRENHKYQYLRTMHGLSAPEPTTPQLVRRV